MTSTLAGRIGLFICAHLVFFAALGVIASN